MTAADTARAAELRAARQEVANTADELAEALGRYHSARRHLNDLLGAELFGGTTPTPADVKAHPAYWITGPGRAVASVTPCPHGYNLTDSCPMCDAEADQ